MHLTTTTTTTTTLSLLDLALANPIASITRENPSGVPTPMPPQLVSMDLYPGAHCSPGTANATLALADTACHALNSAKGLRVVHFDEKKLRYNALRVFEGDECEGGWMLKPIYCDGGVCGCSRVVRLGSVRVVTDE